MTTSNAERFAQTVSSYEGTPYYLLGRTPGESLDCVGIIACALAALGLPFEDCVCYSLRRTDNRYPFLCKHLTTVFTPAAEPFLTGDVVAYRIPGPAHGVPGHAVVVVEGGMIVEANPLIQKVVKTVPPRNWRERILAMHGEFSVWRLPNG